jgi:hypothetical protein
MWRHRAQGLRGDYRVLPEDHAQESARCPLCQISCLKILLGDLMGTAMHHVRTNTPDTAFLLETQADTVRAEMRKMPDV